MNLKFRSMLIASALALSSPAFAGQQTVKLSVPSMYCDACPAIVKGSLQKVAGVAKVETSLEQKTAVVTFDDAKASVADLIKATTNAGYPSTQVAGP
jgi:periplasmic mercuric ion binding protein